MATKLTKRDKAKLTIKFRHAASTSSGRIHVVPSRSGWSVKMEGAKRASAVKATKNSAVTVAKKMKTSKRIIVHKKDGTIQQNIGKG